MSKPLHQVSAAFDRFPGWHTSDRKDGASRPAILSFQQILIWISRHRQRKALAELTATSDYLLRDIGLSRDEALREAAKPFWR